MTRRPALGTATAALCALLALTACQGSPKAGQPNTTPTTPTATETPTTPTTPTWGSEDQAAIAAAKARYTVARAAVGQALGEPTKATREALEKAGNGGAWVTRVAEQIHFQVKYGWYQTGQVTIESTTAQSVKLDLPQPEVWLVSCIDSSKLVMRYKSSGKPVPMKLGDGKRRKVQAQLVYAAPAGGTKKMWFLVDEKSVATC